MQVEFVHKYNQKLIFWIGRIKVKVSVLCAVTWIIQSLNDDPHLLFSYP